MTKRIVKKAAFAMACTIAVTAFAGCGSNADKTTTPEATAQAQTAAKEQTPVNISWLAYQTVAQPDPNSQIVQDVQKKFNAKFDFWFVDEKKWDDTLNVKLAAGEVPDVMLLKTKTNIGKYVNQGLIGELPIDTITKYAPTYVKTVNQYDTQKYLWAMTNLNGKNYGFSFVTADGSYPTSLIWNKTWLDNIGITKTPETIAEVEDTLYKFRNNDPDKNGKKDTYGISNTALMSIMGAYGPIPIKDMKGTSLQQLYWFKKADGTIDFACTQPEMKEALTTLQKWYKDGVIDPEFVTGENTGGYWAVSQAFINGRVGITGSAMYYHWTPPLSEGDKGGAVYQEYLKSVPNGALDKTYTFGKAPVGPKGKSGLDQWGYTGESMVMSAAALKDSRKVETVLKMVEATHADKAYADEVTYGIKDVDYTINKDGVYNSSVSVAEDARKKGIAVFAFLSTNPEFAKKNNPPKFQFADKVKTTGYYPLPISSNDAYTKYYTALQKLTQEYYIKIVTGEYSIDKFDEFVKKFNENGGTEVVKATNADWKATH